MGHENSMTEIGDVKVLSYDFPADSGTARVLIPRWKVEMSGLPDGASFGVSGVRVTDSLSDVMTQADITLNGIVDYDDFDPSVDKEVSIYLGYSINDSVEYSLIYKGILDTNNLSVTSRTEGFSIGCRDFLAKISHPWFNTILSRSWTTKVYVSEIIGYCVGLSGMTCRYMAYNWQVDSYDTAGKYPIDVIREFVDKAYAFVTVDYVNNIVTVNPKIPPVSASPIITIRDNNDIVLLGRTIEHGQYYNRVSVKGNQSNFSVQDPTTSGGSYEKVVDYSPLGLMTLLTPPEIPTINGGDPSTYAQDFETWQNQNVGTWGDDVLGGEINFDSSPVSLPTTVKKAPDDPYTDEDPKNCFFEEEFLNTGVTINPNSIVAHGGMKKVSEDGKTVSYTGAKYKAGSYIVNVGKVRIPWNVVENPSYRPDELRDGTDQEPVTLIDRWVTSRDSITNALISYVYMEATIYTDGNTKWRYFKKKDKEGNAEGSVVYVGWFSSTSEGGTSRLLTFLSRNPNLVDVTDETSGGIKIHKNIDTLAPPLGPGLRAAPPSTYRVHNSRTDENGKGVFYSIPLADYTVSLNKAGWQTDSTKSYDDKLSNETISQSLTVITGESSYNKKYVKQDTEYLWVVTATTKQLIVPVADPTAVDYNISITVDDPAAIQSFGRVVQPTSALEDPIITNRATAYYIGGMFVKWAVGTLKIYNFKIPSVPIKLKGKLIRLISYRLGINDVFYVIDHTVAFNTKSCWDEIRVMKVSQS